VKLFGSVKPALLHLPPGFPHPLVALERANSLSVDRMRASASVLQSIETLVLTLERGWAGKGQYLAVLQHLGLTKRQKVVEVPNTFEYRATARKVRMFTCCSPDCCMSSPFALPLQSKLFWHADSAPAQNRDERAIRRASSS
jgi:ribosomal protein L30/L7E